ncbi:MAG: BrnT family toxin [Candidatus Nanopelagicales bacterium]|nr:BrnT family toxin [Candidatus Nanopelagicales bacterium]MCF8538133.1 BrnT family toxin [Candidatus Nanopelagicales bacterium]MCF8543138.1 BrnT family toxin [Candidatus Nanopelagicales bacterium]MCF8556582.1 BrnT family toxin [Candidatus Nanopelagicales bacterium]
MDIPFSDTFIYDVAKSQANQDKHGIDFDQAQRLWLDENCVTAPARSHHERRWIVIGQVDGRIWAAIVTQRHSAIRIISVRRARRNEEEAYGRGRTR